MTEQPFLTVLRTQPAETWTSVVTSCLADAAQEALDGTKAEIGVLHATLVDSFRQAVCLLPETARTALLSSEPSELRAAYALGQLAFAQVMLSHALLRRADDDFVEVVTGEEFGGIANALITPSSKQELSDMLGLNVAEISRRLRVLLDKGAVDFRVENRVARYELTPAGRAVLVP